jgi:hypothetical protein
MALVADLVAVTDLLKSKIDANKTTLGIQALFFGDQSTISVVPAVCVEPGTKVAELRGVPRKTEVDITVFILVYHSIVTQSVQQTLRDATLLAESIEALIHQDPHLRNGVGNSENVIHCFVTNIEAGYPQKATTTFRAARMTVTAKTQEFLPQDL